MLSYILYQIASFGVRRLPRGTSTRLASTIAFLFYLFRFSIRRNVGRNLKALGAEGTGTFNVFRNFSRTIVDFLSMDSGNPAALHDLCTIAGLEHIDTALDGGRGAILFAPHQGPWEVAGAFLASKGYRIHTIALDHPSSGVTRFFSRRRTAWGIVDYPPGDGVVKLRDALRANEIVVLLVDRKFSTKGIRLTFLGRRVRLPQGHVKLARRTGSPLIPCCCHYTEEGTIEVVIDEPLRASEGPVQAVAEECLARIEVFLRDRPDQWFAFDHLWPEEKDVR
jgi:KDO2-lipid IV(A) lauroyltransferase